MTTAYIETSIPSFQFTGRTDPHTIARQKWTQQWFAQIAPEITLYSSLAVTVDLEGGTLEDLKSLRISFIDELPMLEIRNIRRQISEECDNDPEKNLRLLPCWPRGIEGHWQIQVRVQTIGCRTGEAGHRTKRLSFRILLHHFVSFRTSLLNIAWFGLVWFRIAWFRNAFSIP